MENYSVAEDYIFRTPEEALYFEDYLRRETGIFYCIQRTNKKVTHYIDWEKADKKKRICKKPRNCGTIKQGDLIGEN